MIWRPVRATPFEIIFRLIITGRPSALFLSRSLFLSFPRCCHGKNIFRSQASERAHARYAASGTYLCESRFMKQQIFELQIKSTQPGNEYRVPFHVSINLSIAICRNGTKKTGGGEQQRRWRAITSARRKQKQDKRTKKKEGRTRAQVHC